TYKPMKYNVSAIKNANPLLPPNPGPINVQIYPPNTTTGAPTISQAWFNGCIEERDTYEITDYNNVDFSKALDLNLDLIPSGSDKTQWRPQFTDLPFARSMWWDGTGTWTQADTDMGSDFLNPTWSGNATCPTTSKRLQTWDTATLGTYVDSLVADGETYHDIGMIWGGRLISPTGLFASDNADVNNMPTSRHLIFLTDGITQPYDVSYSSYGIEPLDQRRLSIGNIAKLKTTIESRFGVACAEVKKKNVSVWVIGFDTTLNKAMTDCAGPGHYFEAKDAASLANVFSTIAASMGDLRLAK
ncbi:MAG: hypothetical protein KGP14_16565, partial [Betaproteobacteria bacterium]|nr:hypothetical protein [Betaproteobacteria bacterium]